MEAVYGCFMLTCIGMFPPIIQRTEYVQRRLIGKLSVAMLPDGHALIDRGGNLWACLFPIEGSRANLIKMKVLQAVDYDLDLSKWTLAVHQLDSVGGQLSGLEHTLLSVSRLEEIRQSYNFASKKGDKRELDIALKSAELLRRSLLEVRGEFLDDLQIWNKTKLSLSSALYPLFLYEPSTVDHSLIDQLIRDPLQKQTRIELSVVDSHRCMTKSRRSGIFDARSFQCESRTSSWILKPHRACLPLGCTSSAHRNLYKDFICYNTEEMTNEEADTEEEADTDEEADTVRPPCTGQMLPRSTADPYKDYRLIDKMRVLEILFAALAMYVCLSF